MVRLYFDIETYRRENRAFDEKVVAIGVLEDWTRYAESSLSEEATLRLFTEWELGSEEKVVREFYRHVEEVNEGANFVCFVGFNVLRFDIPLLVQKGVEYGVSDVSSLNRFWHDTYTVDMFQVMLPANDMTFRGCTLEAMAERARKAGLQVPEPYGRGEQVGVWYERRERRDREAPEGRPRSHQSTRPLEGLAVLTPPR